MKKTIKEKKPLPDGWWLEVVNGQNILHTRPGISVQERLDKMYQNLLTAQKDIKQLSKIIKETNKE